MKPVRLRMALTVVQEYDADPADYVQDGGTITPEEMAEIDRLNAIDDPFPWVAGAMAGTDEDTVDVQARCEVVTGPAPRMISLTDLVAFVKAHEDEYFYPPSADTVVDHFTEES